MPRALVLSGNGVRGAFQAGVVHRLAENSGESWQIVHGISTGALNAVLAVQGRLDDMVQLWENQAARGLTAFRSRLETAAAAAPPGILTVADVQAIDALFDSRELAESLEPYTAVLPAHLEAREAQLRLQVACLQTGESLLVDPAQDVIRDEIETLLLAALAVPQVFDPVTVTLRRDGLACSGRAYQFAGGETLSLTPIGDAVRTAATAGIELEGIDVVLCTPPSPEATPHEYHGLLEIGFRATDLAVDAIYRAELERFRMANHLAGFRAGTGSANPSAIPPEIDAAVRDCFPAGRYRPLELRLIRPTAASWREFTGRDDADLTGEFPAPLDRNGELARLILDYGRWLADQPGHHLLIPR